MTQFALLEEIPSSGGTEVYRAQMTNDAGLVSLVLLKRLPQKLAKVAHARAAFDKERQVIASLSHPGIVRIVTSGEHQGAPFFALEWVAGTNLDKPIDALAEREALLPLDASVCILQAVCEALAHAHDASIVHRDVKPSNILIDRAGMVKLADFGCAKELAGASATRTTKTGTLRGTLPYLPPERVLERPFDHRVDVYAAGVVFYEMITGYNPFLDATDYKTLERILEASIPPPSAALEETGLTPQAAVYALDGLVMQAIDRNPDARFPTARAFSDAVLAAAAKATLAPSRRSLKAIISELAVATPASRPIETFEA